MPPSSTATFSPSPPSLPPPPGPLLARINPRSCPSQRPPEVAEGCGGLSLSSPGGDERADEEGRGGGDEDLERALAMDGSSPGSSQEFVLRVSSSAYDMRRNLMQTIDSISYDEILSLGNILHCIRFCPFLRVLDTNPWREDSKPVYVLTQRDSQLWTMKTHRSRSEVERELDLLFSKGGKRGSAISSKAKHSSVGTKFHMLVEDIREGVLISIENIYFTIYLGKKYALLTDFDKLKELS